MLEELTIEKIAKPWKGLHSPPVYFWHISNAWNYIHHTLRQNIRTSLHLSFPVFDRNNNHHLLIQIPKLFPQAFRYLCSTTKHNFIGSTDLTCGYDERYLERGQSTVVKERFFVQCRNVVLGVYTVVYKGKY